MTSDDGTAHGEASLSAATPVEGVVVRPGQQLPSDPKALEALIAERRSHLAATIDELVVRAHPKEIARRSVADARSRVQAFALTPAGDLRVERIGAVVGAVAAVVVTLALLRRRFAGRAG